MHSVKDIEMIWDSLAATFSNKAGLKLRMSWFDSGLSERTGPKRLRNMEDGAEAKAFFEDTKNCTPEQLSYLRSRAVVNVEQAASAMRVNTVMNVTIIVGSLVLINQVFPGLIQKYIQQGMADKGVAGIISSIGLPLLFVVMSAAIVGYSYAGLAKARDLKHLLDLALSRRGLDDDTGAAQEAASLAGDLRKNFLSDI